MAKMSGARGCSKKAQLNKIKAKVSRPKARVMKIKAKVRRPKAKKSK